MKNQESNPTTPTKKVAISLLGSSPKLKGMKITESTEPKKALPKMNLTGTSGKFVGRNTTTTVENKKPVATMDALEEVKATVRKLSETQAEKIQKLDSKLSKQKIKNEELQTKLNEQGKKLQEDLDEKINFTQQGLEIKIIKQAEQAKESSEAQTKQVEELQTKIKEQGLQNQKSQEELGQRINTTKKSIKTQLEAIEEDVKATKEALDVTASYALKVNMEQCDIAKVLIAIEKKIDEEEFTPEDEGAYLNMTQQDTLKEAIEIFGEYSVLTTTLEQINASINREEELGIFEGEDNFTTNGDEGLQLSGDADDNS